MKKYIILITILFLSISCSKVDENEVRKVMKNYITINTEFIQAMKAADGPNTISTAVRHYSNSIRNILPMMRKVEKKDNSISFKKRFFPFKYNSLAKKIILQERSISIMTMKASAYAHLPKVKNAFAELTSVYQNR